MATDKQKESKSRGRSGWPALLWVVFAVGLCLVIGLVHARGQEVYAGLDVALPAIVELSMRAGEFLRSPVGIGSALAGLALSLVPFGLGTRGTFAGRTYLLLAFVAGIASTLIWISNTHALAEITSRLGTS